MATETDCVRYEHTETGSEIMCGGGCTGTIWHDTPTNGDTNANMVSSVALSAASG